MKKEMQNYYISRGIISIAFGLVVYLFTQLFWLGLLMIILIFGVFIYLPNSGRYKLEYDGGVTPMRRDEWTQRINDKAGRNAWILVALMGSFFILYFGLISPGDIPVYILGIIIFSGFAAYFISDFWLRRL